jgi:hypothetical protein
VGALKDKSARPAAPGRGEEFEQAVDRTILEGAEMGLAARPARAPIPSFTIGRGLGQPARRRFAKRCPVRCRRRRSRLKSVTVQVSARTSVAELRAQFRRLPVAGRRFRSREDRSVLVNRLGLLAIGLASIGIGAGIGAYLA